ncbi:hypothetical protein TW81_11600 [Vibrio galatheae]|uniref:Uncharacterized protein n=1 Tax=Vibrio galatheae TaxID=579748 RepID=A0A0F4NIS0_9VIBR|nr:hypothetical protein [Vibrio galatheae]KJY82849.1 hypothetical protein TW81_11600 [Vibrio galatheae]
MKKRILPIPLILLIPIVLLIIVTAAGVYRFSLTDDEILAKFPTQAAKSDAVMQKVFGIRTVNPWTVKVPESQAFTFIDDIEQFPLLKGHYEDGAQRGIIVIDSRRIIEIDSKTFVSTLALSNQGSGTFYYLVVSIYDEFRQRMVTTDSVFLGDRISVERLSFEEGVVTVKLLERDVHQSMSEEPSQLTTILFKVTEQDSLEKQ